MSAPWSGRAASLRLARAVRDDDPLLGAAVPERLPTRGRGPGAEFVQEAVSGPRTAARAGAYELALEAILEGYRLHYEAGAVVSTPDPDLALLGGDRLYAMGLASLAELGDLEAIAELADVISLSAQAHAERDPERARGAWEAGARAVGHGPGPGHAEAKEAARAGRPGAAAALRAAGEASEARLGPAVE